MSAYYMETDSAIPSKQICEKLEKEALLAFTNAIILVRYYIRGFSQTRPSVQLLVRPMRPLSLLCKPKGLPGLKVN